MEHKNLILKVHHAIRDGRIAEAVSLISSHESLLKMVTPFGTWLQDAAEYGSHELATWLIDQGLDVNAYDEKNEEPPLAIACAQGHLRVVRLLVESGANLETHDSVRNPLLSTIVGGGSEAHTEIARLLVERGIDTTVKYPNLENMSALELAKSYGRDGIVKLLEARENRK